MKNWNPKKPEERRLVGSNLHAASENVGLKIHGCCRRRRCNALFLFGMISLAESATAGNAYVARAKEEEEEEKKEEIFSADKIAKQS